MSAGYLGAAYFQFQASMMQLEQQRQHAVAAQVLFDVDRAARALSHVATSDPFAAAVLSRLRLNHLESVDVAAFPTFEEKRTWDSALRRMRDLWAASSSDPSAGRYVRAAAQFAALQQAADNPPIAHLAELSKAANREARRSKQIWLASFAAFPVVFVLSLAAGKPWGPLLLGLAVFVLPVLWIVFGLTFRRYRSAAKVRAADRARQQSRVDEFAAFMEHSEGGKLLQRIAAAHPALLSFDPTNAPAADAAPASSHVVERQVVVSRCRFCGQMAPVDLAGCQHCGAKL